MPQRKRKCSISLKEPERLGFIVFSVSPVGHLGFFLDTWKRSQNGKPWKEPQFMLFGCYGKRNNNANLEEFYSFWNSHLLVLFSTVNGPDFWKIMQQIV